MPRKQKQELDKKQERDNKNDCWTKMVIVIINVQGENPVPDRVEGFVACLGLRSSVAQLHDAERVGLSVEVGRSQVAGRHDPDFGQTDVSQFFEGSGRFLRIAVKSVIVD